MPRLLDLVQEILLLGLLLLGPIPFGSNRPIPLAGLEITAAVLGLCWALRRILSRERVGPPRFLFLCVLVFLAWGMLSAFPLQGGPRTLPAPAPDPSAFLPAHSGSPQFGGWSFAPDLTVEAMKRCFAYAFIFISAASILGRPHARGRFAVALLIAGLGEAVAGIWEVAARGGLPPEGVRGTYANRNHYAALLAMALPVGMAWFARRADEASKPPESATSAGARRTRSARWVLAAGAGLGLLLAAGLFLSLSRGGIVAALLGLVVYAILQPGGSAWTRPVRLIGIVAAVAGLGAILAYNPLTERLRTVERDVDAPLGRPAVWKMTVDAGAPLADRGAGPGAFPEIVRATTDPGTVHRVRVNHAHNDYLEIWLEWGWPGSAAAALFLAGLAVTALRSRRFDPHPVTLGAMAALVGQAAHALLEFNLQIPANAVWIAALAGGVVLRPRRSPPAPPAAGLSRLVIGGGGLVVAGALILAAARRVSGDAILEPARPALATVWSARELSPPEATALQRWGADAAGACPWSQEARLAEGLGSLAEVEHNLPRRDSPPEGDTRRLSIRLAAAREALVDAVRLGPLNPMPLLGLMRVRIAESVLGGSAAGDGHAGSARGAHRLGKAAAVCGGGDSRVVAALFRHGLRGWALLPPGPERDGCGDLARDALRQLLSDERVEAEPLMEQVWTATRSVDWLRQSIPAHASPRTSALHALAARILARTGLADEAEEERRLGLLAGHPSGVEIRALDQLPQGDAGAARRWRQPLHQLRSFVPLVTPPSGTARAPAAFLSPAATDPETPLGPDPELVRADVRHARWLAKSAAPPWSDVVVAAEEAVLWAQIPDQLPLLADLAVWIEGNRALESAAPRRRAALLARLAEVRGDARAAEMWWEAAGVATALRKTGGAPTLHLRPSDFAGSLRRTELGVFTQPGSTLRTDLIWPEGPHTVVFEAAAVGQAASIAAPGVRTIPMAWRMDGVLWTEMRIPVHARGTAPSAVPAIRVPTVVPAGPHHWDITFPAEPRLPPGAVLILVRGAVVE